ncbi:unnamed protein product, partial [Symbiodinium sp. CCMP2592]
LGEPSPTTAAASTPQQGAATKPMQDSYMSAPTLKDIDELLGTDDVEEGLLDDAIEDYDEEDAEMAPAEETQVAKCQEPADVPMPAVTVDVPMPAVTVSDPAVASDAVHAALLRPSSVDLMSREQLARCNTDVSQESSLPAVENSKQSDMGMSQSLSDALASLSKEEIVELLRKQLESDAVGLTSPLTSPRL